MKGGRLGFINIRSVAEKLEVGCHSPLLAWSAAVDKWGSAEVTDAT